MISIITLITARLWPWVAGTAGPLILGLFWKLVSRRIDVPFWAIAIAVLASSIAGYFGGSVRGCLAWATVTLLLLIAQSAAYDVRELSDSE